MPKTKRSSRIHSAVAAGQLFHVWGRHLLLEAQDNGNLWHGWYLEGSHRQPATLSSFALSQAKPVSPTDLPAELAQRYALLTLSCQTEPVLNGYAPGEASAMQALLKSNESNLRLAEPTLEHTAAFALRYLLERYLRQKRGRLAIVCAPDRQPFWRNLANRLAPLTLSDQDLDLDTQARGLLTFADLHDPHSLPADSLVLLDEPPVQRADTARFAAVSLTLSADHFPTASALRLPVDRPRVPTEARVFKHAPRAAALIRDLDLLCYACGPQLQSLPPERQELGWRTLAELTLHCHRDPAAFATHWRHFRAGIGEGQWASSSELEAAWRAYDDSAGDPRELRLALAAALHLAGAWFLPFAEALDHELRSLDESSAAAPEPDGRCAALRVLLNQDHERWLVVTHDPDQRDQLADLAWPVPSARWSASADPALRLHFAHDAQLLETPACQLNILHFDLPASYGALARRHHRAQRAVVLCDSRSLDSERLLRLFQDPHACSDDYRRHLTHLLLNREPIESGPAPQCLPDQAPPTSGPAPQAALDWFFAGTFRPSPAQSLLAPDHTESSEQRLRMAIARFRHLGAPQVNPLLEALDQVFALPNGQVAGEQARQLLDDGSTLQPDRLWHCQGTQLPLFFQRPGSAQTHAHFLEQVRNWLDGAECCLALATDGHRWLWVPRNPVARPWTQARTSRFFAQGQAQPDLVELHRLIQLYLETPASFPYQHLLPAPDPQPLEKLLQDAVLQILQSLDVQAPIEREHERQLLQALARSLLEMLLARRLEGPYPWSAAPNPWQARVQAALDELSALGWASLHRLFERLEAPDPSAAFDRLAAVLARLRVRFTDQETCLYPIGHRGPAIPISRLLRLEPTAAQRLLQRWRKASAKGDVVKHLPQRPESDSASPALLAWLATAWPEASADERERLAERWPLIPPSTWYLTAASEHAPALEPVTIARLLDQGLSRLSGDASEQSQVAEHWTALKLCDPCAGSGPFLEQALNQLAQNFLRAKQKQRRLTATPQGWQLDLGPSGVVQHLDPAPAALLPWFRHLLLPCFYGLAQDLMELDLCYTRLWLSCAPFPVRDLTRQLRLGHALIGTSPGQAAQYPLRAWERETGDEHYADFVHHAHTVYPSRGSRTRAQTRGDVWATALRRQRELVRLDHTAWQRETEAAQAQADLALEAVAPPRREDQTLTCDLWCALWFWPGDDLAEAPTPRGLATPTPKAAAIAAAIAQDLNFVHWSLHFPIGTGTIRGFDAVIGQAPDRRERQSRSFLWDSDPLYRYLSTKEKAHVRRELFQDAGLEKTWLGLVARERALSHFLRCAAEPAEPGKSSAAYRFRPRATAASGSQAWMMTELALRLLRPGGSLVWTMDAAWTHHPRATELRRLLLSSDDSQCLTLLPSAPALAALTLRQRAPQAELAIVQPRDEAAWLHGQAPIRQWDKHQLTALNPHSRAIPLLADTRLSALLQRLHQHATSVHKSTNGWQVVPYQQRRPHGHIWQDTGLGFWIKGTWPADPLALPLETLMADVFEVNGPTQLDPSYLEFPLTLAEGPYWFRPGPDARQALRLHPSEIAALGCMASLPGLFLGRAKWGPSITLARLQHEFPLPSTSEPSLLLASVTTLLHEPRFAPWRQHLCSTLSLPVVDVQDESTRLRHAVFLDAAMAVHAGLDSEDCAALCRYFQTVGTPTDPFIRARLERFGEAVHRLSNHGGQALLEAPSQSCAVDQDELVERDRGLTRLVEALVAKVPKVDPVKIQQSSLPF